MELKKYYRNTILLALIVSPIAVSIGVIVSLFTTPLIYDLFSAVSELPIFVLFIVLSVLCLSGMWILYAKKIDLPEKASELFLPFFVAFCYYMCAWIILFGISGYRLDSEFFTVLRFLFTLPYFIVNIVIAFSGVGYLFPLANTAITMITLLTVIITRKVRKKRIVFDKRTLVYCLGFVVLSGIAGFQYYDRSTKILSFDHDIERIEDEVNLYQYALDNEQSKLQKLGEPATIQITSDYPRLDGATAAYPVYAAMAKELYSGLNWDWETAEDYVTCTNTRNAYDRLINGEADIFFGAEPSARQREAAKEKGVELVLTPIGKEAFVFFVNAANPVTSLTLTEIQDIYLKKIVNWKDLGGNREKIMPFQRPENSGSQTIMLAKVMGDIPLPPPLWEEHAADMGGLISEVAAYRNYSSAIGYSFRYFATGMKPSPNIKLINIDGIAPTVENIRSGVYPFTIDVYAVTAGTSNKNAEVLIQWILSEQGQSFIETYGYVRN